MPPGRGSSPTPATTPRSASVVDTLAEEEVVYAAPMAEPLRKQAHFASANALRSRDVMGRSVKRA